MLDTAGPVSPCDYPARPPDLGHSPPRCGPGATDARGRGGRCRRPAPGHPCRDAFSVRRAGVGDRASTSAAPAIRHIARRFPASQPAPRQAPPTDTAPAASQTLLPPPHSPPSVPDLAPSHHTHLHLLVRTTFLRHEKTRNKRLGLGWKGPRRRHPSRQSPAWNFWARRRVGFAAMYRRSALACRGVAIGCAYTPASCSRAVA